MVTLIYNHQGYFGIKAAMPNLRKLINLTQSHTAPKEEH